MCEFVLFLGSHSYVVCSSSVDLWWFVRWFCWWCWCCWFNNRCRSPLGFLCFVFNPFLCLEIVFLLHRVPKNSLFLCWMCEAFFSRTEETSVYYCKIRDQHRYGGWRGGGEISRLDVKYLVLCYLTYCRTFLEQIKASNSKCFIETADLQTTLWQMITDYNANITALQVWTFCISFAHWLGFGAYIILLVLYIWA